MAELQSYFRANGAFAWMIHFYMSSASPIKNLPRVQYVCFQASLYQAGLIAPV